MILLKHSVFEGTILKKRHELNYLDKRMALFLSVLHYLVKPLLKGCWIDKISRRIGTKGDGICRIIKRKNSYIYFFHF